MKLLAIQKIESSYNLVFIAGDYSPTLILTEVSGNCEELYNNKETPIIDSSVDIKEMVRYITDVIGLFENGTRKKGSSSYVYVISELKFMYLKHGYDLSILTSNELEAALLLWGRALAAEVKENGFHHNNTNYSTWEYKKDDFRIDIPYTLRDIKTTADFKAIIRKGYGDNCLVGHGSNITELLELLPIASQEI